MTSRHKGRKAASPPYRNNGSPQNTGNTRASSKESRQLIQFVICGGIFVLLVAGKLLLPQKMAQLNARFAEALERNMDIEAVFSAVGNAFAGEESVSQAAGQVYQAVFGAALEEDEAVVEAAVSISGEQAELALETLEPFRQEATTVTEQPPPPTEEADPSAAYVLYADLPENVSMEQAVLNFDYCTPVSGTLSSDFGYREHPVEGDDRFHYGVDLAADTGTEIRCFADGTVTAIGESSSYGNYCIVSHEGGYTTLYAHCSRIVTSSGAAVKQGTVIAEVGETGMVTGPHLHFELQKEGVYLNPIYYVSGQ